jgi:hypothetical protein
MNDFNLIHRIAERAVALYRHLDAIEPRNERFAETGIVHELFTVHEQIIPLRLADMLAADDGNFAHDIAGIHQHLRDGKKPYLADGFCPRFAKVEP